MSQALRSPDAKTLVIWDYKTCPIPTDFQNRIGTLVDRIKQSIRALDCNGPVLFKAYGSSDLISDELKQAMESAGIIVTPVPTGPAATNVMILDTYRWAMENPPPSYIMYISGNDDFADTLAYLKSKGHLMLLLYPPNY